MNKKAVQQTLVFGTAVAMLLTTFVSCANKRTNVSPSSSASVTSASASEESSGISDSSSQAASAIQIQNALASGSENGGAGGTQAKSNYKTASYSSKSYFNSQANKLETKIGINNRSIKAPSINPNAIAATPIVRTTIEGVDGEFIDRNIQESNRNLNGKTFYFGTFWPDAWTTKGSGGMWSNSERQRCAAAIASTERDYNCTIKIVPLSMSTYLAKATAAKSSGTTFADIFASQQEMGSLITSGDLADLRSVKSVNFDKYPWNPVQSLISSYKDKVYGVALRYDLIERNVVFYNKVLAQKYNLGDFYDMVKKGQWTDDRFLQIAQAYKKRGDASTWACDSFYPDEILDLVYSNWSSPFGITNKKYIFNGDDSSVLNILSFCQDFVKQGLFNPHMDTAAEKAADGSAYQKNIGDSMYSIGQFNAGKCLFLIGCDNYCYLIAAQAKNDYGILPLPKGPTAQGYTSVIHNAQYFSLMAGDQNLEDAGTVMVALSNRSNIRKADVSVALQPTVRNTDSLQALLDNYTYKQIISIDTAPTLPMEEIYFSAVLPCVIKQDSSPKQAVDSISHAAQTAIDKSYGQ